MADPLIRKLGHVIALSEGDKQLLAGLFGNVRHLAAKRDVIREGDRPDHVRLVLEGWAARYKVLPNGSRQITAFLVPGDMCDLHVTMLKEMDHSIAALSPVTVADVPHAAIAELAQARPDLNRALWWSTLVDEAVLRAWIVSLGRRSAMQRMAHLFCELHVRLGNVGLVINDEFALPVTQEELADALGLTSVHCNRMLRELEKSGRLNRHRGQLKIVDLPSLRHVGGFDPNYLHRGQLRHSGASI